MKIVRIAGKKEGCRTAYISWSLCYPFGFILATEKNLYFFQERNERSFRSNTPIFLRAFNEYLTIRGEFIP